ncbi:MAG: hypothetical protein KAW56_05025 [Candidatus Marinimicrobia bacterium]|nr:hypothetical protein [Candidatus Neomarinimicrobiota bacterium]MCK4446424.1 hypothetical protein [Candidatus Neomarinimicrobiota bacterium]
MNNDEKQQTAKVKNRTLTTSEINLPYCWQRIQDTLFSKLQEKPGEFTERRNKNIPSSNLIIVNFIIDYIGGLVDIQANPVMFLIFSTFYKRFNSLF